MRYVLSCCTLFLMIIGVVVTLHSYGAEPDHPERVAQHPEGSLSLSEPTTPPIPEFWGVARPTDLKVSATPTRSSALISALHAYLPEIVLFWLIGVSILFARLLGGCWISNGNLSCQRSVSTVGSPTDRPTIRRMPGPARATP